MGEHPAAIRQEIEATRERMGDTVDALSYKADVPARTRECRPFVPRTERSIHEKVQGVKSKLAGVGSQVSQATPDGDGVRQVGRQAVGVAQENPLGLAIGAAAAGFLAGMLIPSTRVEHERLGPVADQVKETAQQTAQTHAEELRQSAQDSVQEVAHQTSSPSR